MLIDVRQSEALDPTWLGSLANVGSNPEVPSTIRAFLARKGKAILWLGTQETADIMRLTLQWI